ncbi:MAG: oxygenase MpaB family protein, partial [Microbacterium sp.]
MTQVDALPTPLLARAATPFVALSGAANVIMQLSWPEVGHGVKDSRVVGARLFDDPVRRSRTTVGYLAVAVHGTATERAAFRRATNASHAQVRSLPGEEPAYSAFDPTLQRWVGSCIYRGFEQASEAVWGPLGSDHDAFYAEGVVFGAMLQMPVDDWPAHRAAFDTYWDDGLARARIDDATRAYLMSVVRMEYLPRRIPGWLAQCRIWLTTGFLP